MATEVPTLWESGDVERSHLSATENVEPGPVWYFSRLGIRNDLARVFALWQAKVLSGFRFATETRFASRSRRSYRARRACCRITRCPECFCLNLSLPAVTSFIVLYAREMGIESFGSYFVVSGAIVTRRLNKTVERYRRATSMLEPLVCAYLFFPRGTDNPQLGETAC